MLTIKARFNKQTKDSKKELVQFYVKGDDEKRPELNELTRSVVILKIDGVEAELHQEAQNELRGTGITLQGIGLPSWFVRFKGTNVDGVDNTQRRDLSSAGSGTGDDWVADVEIGHQFGLEIAPKAFGLGVDVLTGLTSNVYITETGDADLS